MIGPDHVRLMAAYNRWQNGNIYGAADGLSEADRQADMGAFFGSIEATLNHLLWGDKMWMHRFSGRPLPHVSGIKSSVNETQDWNALKAERDGLDAEITAWAGAITAADLEGDLTWYSGALGREVSKPYWSTITHFFNHQTHHRGQVHAMLTAKGAKPSDTDLFVMPDTV